LFHLVPARREVTVASAHFEWNYTTMLNIVFLVLAGVIWWLARHRARLGGGANLARDPVCGMQVRVADAPARLEIDGTTHVFCSDGCRDRFAAAGGPAPERALSAR
jgi:YHS domain-containing protein